MRVSFLLAEKNPLYIEKPLRYLAEGAFSFYIQPICFKKRGHASGYTETLLLLFCSFRQLRNRLNV